MHRLRRRRRRRHRADRRPAGRCRSRTTTTRRRCTSASRRSSARCSSTWSAGCSARASPSEAGRCHDPVSRAGPLPGPPGPGQRLRQDRAGGARARAARRRCRAGLDRVDRCPDRRRRRAGDAGRGGHRLPRVPGRPGQDAAPGGARRHPRRPAARLAPGPAGRARHRAVRPGGRQPLPVPRHGGVRRRRRTSASSRSTSAARRWCARRPRTTRRSPSSSTRRATRTCSTRSPPAASRCRSDRRLAAAAFAHTAAYDAAVAEWFQAELARRPGAAGRPSPGSALVREAVLRYGENPHQRAALYRDPSAPPGLARPSSCTARRCSYNNYVDTDAARRAAHDHDRPCVAIIKHANPCGIAVGDADDAGRRARKAHACDPVSAFGGVIAVNRPVTVAMAEQVAEIFTEVVVAPAFEPGRARGARRARRTCGCSRSRASRPEPGDPAGAAAALLVQTADAVADAGRRPGRLDPRGRRRRPTSRRWPTWPSPGGPAARSSPTRSCSPPAARRSGSGWARSTGSTRRGWPSPGPATGRPASVAASDAFFPFADGLQVLADAGVRAVVQPGGSVRDEEVVAAAARGRPHHVPDRRPALRPLRAAARTTAPPTRRGQRDRLAGRGTRTTLDGKATAAGSGRTSPQRVARLREQGIVPGPRHRAGRRRPGQPVVRRRQAPRLRRGRHRLHPAGAARRRDPGRRRGGRRRAQRRPGVHRLHRPAPAAGRAGRRRRARAGWTRPRTPTGCTRPTSAGWSSEDGPLPCTPRGIVELLRRYDVPLAGAEVVVVGRGVTVGRPLGLLLTRRTENATVTLCHTGTRDLAAHLRRADVVVAAAGVPGLVTADMVRPGAAVLDVGITRTDAGLVGDVAPEVRDVAGYVAPMPGGVGPMTRAMLLHQRRRERRACPARRQGGGRPVTLPASPTDDRPPIRGGWVGRQWPLLTVLGGGVTGLLAGGDRALPAAAACCSGPRCCSRCSPGWCCPPAGSACWSCAAGRSTSWCSRDGRRAGRPGDRGADTRLTGPASASGGIATDRSLT